MQIGRGQFEPVNAAQGSDMKVDYFRYKDSISEDIQHADLVISHAGIVIVGILCKLFVRLIFHNYR